LVGDGVADGSVGGLQEGLTEGVGTAYPEQVEAAQCIEAGQSG
jgi:hypothetical protein